MIVPGRWHLLARCFTSSSLPHQYSLQATYASARPVSLPARQSMFARSRLPSFFLLFSLLLASSTHAFILAMALKTPKPTFGGIAHAGILVSDTQASLVRA